MGIHPALNTQSEIKCHASLINNKQTSATLDLGSSICYIIASTVNNRSQTNHLFWYILYVNLLGQEVYCVAMNLGEAYLTECHLTCIGTAQIRILCDLHK